MMELFAHLGTGALLAWAVLPLLSLAVRRRSPCEPASTCRALSLVLAFGALFFVLPLARSVVHPGAIAQAPFGLADVVRLAQTERFATPAGPASPLALVGAFWVLVAGAAFMLGLARASSLRSVIASATPAPDGLVRRAATLAARWGLAAPRVLVSAECATPFTSGALRPNVVIPQALVEAFSGEELELVLLHELSHVARRDPLVNTLLALPRALFALHPTARRLTCQIRLARELAVDAKVAALAPHAYPRMLVEAAHQARFGAPPCTIAMHRSDLEARLAALSREPPRARAGLAAPLVTGGLLFVVALLAPRVCLECAASGHVEAGDSCHTRQ